MVFQPDSRDDLRRADALFSSRRYYDAFTLYRSLAARTPTFALAWARLGMVLAVRGDANAASSALGQAIGMGLTSEDQDLVRLYQGRVGEITGLHDEAAQFWGLIGQNSPFAPFAHVLLGESRLHSGDYSGAESAFRSALSYGLPENWRVFTHTRLALIRASSDPDGALAEIASIGKPVAPPWFSDHRDAMVVPLLQATGPDTRQVAAALQAAPELRAQLLGQIYLQAGLYPLAEAQFAAVPGDSAGRPGVAVYAAYARWLAGDQAGGRQRLEALVASHPSDTRARAILALVALAANDPRSARAQLAIALTMAPADPDAHLAFAQWYTAQRDYVAAGDQYRAALAVAPTGQRGVYALAQARFHLDTGLDICETGLAAAVESVRLLPDDPQPLNVLAGIRLSCGDASGAREAAAGALSLDPASAEASYLLGKALGLLGERAAARRALVGAADLAPASSWRERAEAQIAVLGL